MNNFDSFSSLVYRRSGRLCPDRTQHCVQDFSGKPTHHSWSYALWEEFRPRCSFQYRQTDRSGHQWAPPAQPDRSAHLAIYSPLFSVTEFLKKPQLSILSCKNIIASFLLNSCVIFISEILKGGVKFGIHRLCNVETIQWWDIVNAESKPVMELPVASNTPGCE